MFVVIIICIISVLLIIGLTLYTTHKGYEYKQTIDPLPEDTEKEGINKDERE